MRRDSRKGEISLASEHVGSQVVCARADKGRSPIPSILPGGVEALIVSNRLKLDSPFKMAGELGIASAHPGLLCTTSPFLANGSPGMRL